MKMQKINIYVSVLAMMIACQSYAASSPDEKVGDSAASRPVDPGAPVLEDVLRCCGSRITDLLDLVSRARLSQASKDAQRRVTELVPVFKLFYALRQTDFSPFISDPFAVPDLRALKATLSDGDEYYLDAMAIKQELQRTLKENGIPRAEWETAPDGAGYREQINSLMDRAIAVGSVCAEGYRKDKAPIELLIMTLDNDEKYTKAMRAKFVDTGALRAHLIDLSAGGDRNANKMLNEAARKGELGFDQKTGRKHLEARIREGDRHAKNMLMIAATHWGLDFKEEWGGHGTHEKSALEYIIKLIRAGDLDAENLLIETAFRMRSFVPVGYANRRRWTPEDLYVQALQVTHLGGLGRPILFQDYRLHLIKCLQNGYYVSDEVVLAFLGWPIGEAIVALQREYRNR